MIYLRFRAVQIPGPAPRDPAGSEAHQGRLGVGGGGMGSVPHVFRLLPLPYSQSSLNSPSDRLFQGQGTSNFDPTSLGFEKAIPVQKVTPSAGLNPTKSLRERALEDV